MKLKALFIAALVISIFTSECFGCTEYIHFWSPVKETRENLCSAEGLRLFLEDLTLNKVKLSSDEKAYISISPDSTINEAFKENISKSVNLLNNKNITMLSEGSPFSQQDSPRTTIWLDFVKPEKLTYFWRDENKPPLAMLRYGELETAQIRVMAISSTNSVIFIDEIPFMHLLETDFMLPSWMSVGGVWMRRVSLKVLDMKQRHEWTIMVPSDPESVNAVPTDIKRFYYDTEANSNVKIISNF
jgi:hypothetical protein